MILCPLEEIGYCFYLIQAHVISLRAKNKLNHSSDQNEIATSLL